MVLAGEVGAGKPFIESQPSHIIRFRGKPGEELRDQVRFTSHLPGNFEIKAFKTNIPQFIEVTLKAEEPGRIYVVEVKNKRREAGNYAGNIELSTTSAKRPGLILRVFGELPCLRRKATEKQCFHYPDRTASLEPRSDLSRRKIS